MAWQVLVVRAAKALCTLVNVLLASSLVLVPAQTSAVIGAELTLLGLCAWIVISWTGRVTYAKNPYVTEPRRWFAIVLTQVGGGAVHRGGRVAAHRPWRWPLLDGHAAFFSLLISLLDGWVLLIEIQR